MLDFSSLLEGASDIDIFSTLLMLKAHFLLESPWNSDPSWDKLQKIPMYVKYLTQ